MTENKYEKLNSFEREQTLHQERVQGDLTTDLVNLSVELSRGKISEHVAIRTLKNIYDYEMEERGLTYEMLLQIVGDNAMQGKQCRYEEYADTKTETIDEYGDKVS